YQPKLVLADLNVLKTLPEREMRAGCAEVIKYGLIDNADFFSWLEREGTNVRDCEPRACRRAVLTSCAAKAAIVTQDETERGSRALLNLGHTFGHALEAETGYGDALRHGEAVAIGMAMALELSQRLGLCPPEDTKRLRHLLGEIGLPFDTSGLECSSWTAGTLLTHMAKDKKVSGGKITFILSRGIGKAFVANDVKEADVISYLETAIAS
ncbi:MAG: 3-dehydroquinate synthase, partial [Rhodospirillales bacterium]|nr:3-dehydroquinate synthase [Rhodospirillales bacterium]